LSASYLVVTAAAAPLPLRDHKAFWRGPDGAAARQEEGERKHGGALARAYVLEALRLASGGALGEPPRGRRPASTA
jgi:hypothetical protein